MPVKQYKLKEDVYVMAEVKAVRVYCLWIYVHDVCTNNREGLSENKRDLWANFVNIQSVLVIFVDSRPGNFIYRGQNNKMASWG